MNIPIKTYSISSKPDQDTDQETWILISLNTKYSIFAASIITYNNNRAKYYSFLGYLPPDFLATSIMNFDNQ